MSTTQTLLLGAIAGFTIYVGLPMGRLQNVSPDTLSLLDQEVRTLVSNALINAKQAIDSHRDVVTTLADLLEVQETVEGDQLRKVLARTRAAVGPYPSQPRRRRARASE